MRTSGVIFGLLCTGAALAAGGSARADFTVAPAPATIPLTQTDWGPSTVTLAGLNPLQLDQFDASKYAVNGQVAVLTGVDVKVDYEFDNSLTLQFANMSTITVNAQGTLNVFMPDGTTPLVATATFANTGSLTANPATLLMKTVTLPHPPITGSNLASYSDAATLAKFTGKSTIGLPAFAQATSKFTTSSGNGFGSSTTFANAKVSLLYHYILLAPEPSSVVLMGIGVLGLFHVARRHAKRTKGVVNESV